MTDEQYTEGDREEVAKAVVENFQVFGLHTYIIYCISSKYQWLKVHSFLAAPDINKH